MAKRTYIVDIDLQNNSLIQAKLENLSSAPVSPTTGRFYFDTTLGKFGVYNGTVWHYFDDLTGLINGNGPISVTFIGGVATVNIADATTSTSGAMSAADKTKLDGATNTDTANTLVQRDGNGDFEANNITITGTPSADTDAASVAYVKNAVQGLDTKEAARLATTTNITLSGAQNIDGLVVAIGDRILVKDQTNTVENGIYIADTGGAWTRADDFDSGEEIASSYLFVEEGTVNGDTGWTATNDGGSDVVGTDGISFAQFSSAGTILDGDGLEKIGNQLNVKVDNTKAIEIVADALGLKLADTSLEFDASNGVRVKIKPAGGIIVDGDGLSLDASTFTELAKVGYKTLTTGQINAGIAITHNFGTESISVTAIDASTKEVVQIQTVITDTNNVTVTANNAANSIKVTIIGNVGTVIA